MSFGKKFEEERFAVCQADRLAAADILRSDITSKLILKGELDDMREVQAFARHRKQSGEILVQAVFDFLDEAIEDQKLLSTDVAHKMYHELFKAIGVIDYTNANIPHPRYGGCDAFGPQGKCSQCTGLVACDDGKIRVIEDPLSDAYFPDDELTHKAIEIASSLVTKTADEHFSSISAARIGLALGIKIGQSKNG